MDPQSGPSSKISRARSMKGGDPTLLLSRMPNRYSHVVRDRARSHPDRPALRVGPIAMSYGELWQAATAAKETLLKLNIGPGDRVLLVAENGLQVVCLLLALSELDAWAVPLNARMSGREIDAIRSFSNCSRVLYCTGDSQAAAAHASASDPIEQTVQVLGPVLVSYVNPSARPEPVHQDKAAQTAILVFTSGTTGEPKGVMLSHQALIYMGANMVEVRTITSDDAFYNSSPVSHAIGLGTVLMTAFWAGASVELVARFTPQHFIEALKAELVTSVTSVPTFFARIVDYAEQNNISLRSKRLRIVATAGAPLDLALKARIEDAFGVRMGNSYGMTECNPIARSAAGVETNEVGDLQPGVEIRLVREDGADAGSEESGEIWAKGPCLMLGYYRNDLATSSAMREGGWLATGDLGKVTADGKLFIVGRLKELIIRSGFNVYPVEVESVISAYPGVGQVAVVGRKVPDNEEVVAFVQPIPGVTLDAIALTAWINERLAPYKRPADIVIKPELPVGPTGKVFKLRLRELAAEMVSDRAGN
jgi:long-chain acyl-CoA synthetase